MLAKYFNCRILKYKTVISVNYWDARRYALNIKYFDQVFIEMA